MSKKIVKMLGILIALVVPFTACNSGAKNNNGSANSSISSSSSSKIDYSSREMTLGIIEGDKYSNDYFNLEITAPEGFTIASQDDVKSMMSNVDADDLTSNEKLNEAIKNGEISNLVLTMFVSDTPIGNLSSNIVLVAESIKGKGIKNADDYMDKSNTTLKKSFTDATFDKLDKKDLGGIEFTGQKVSYTMQGTKIFQDQYFAVFGDYILLVGGTYGNDEGRTSLDPVFNNISFKK